MKMRRRRCGGCVFKQLWGNRGNSGFGLERGHGNRHLLIGVNIDDLSLGGHNVEKLEGKLNAKNLRSSKSREEALKSSRSRYADFHGTGIDMRERPPPRSSLKPMESQQRFTIIMSSLHLPISSCFDLNARSSLANMGHNAVWPPVKASAKPQTE